MGCLDNGHFEILVAFKTENYRKPVKDTYMAIREFRPPK